MVGELGIFVSLRSWVKYRGNMEGVGNVGEERQSVLGYGLGVGDEGKMWGEMWKSLWGERGGCGKVGESVLVCGEVWNNMEGHTL